MTDSEDESDLSSEDEEDIQYEILENQRDEANQRLAELEEVSNQLLKEMNVLEMQFQIERACRENAEVLALKVSKENKVLKRKSQMLMPLIQELPENLDLVTLDEETNDAVDGDVADLGEVNNEETMLLESQAKITALQASVDGLLAQNLQLEQQVEELNLVQVQLREQLALEVEEKEAILRKMSKQSKTMNKIKRVSQLVSEEFTEMSQKLELEQGLRQYVEDFAQQMIVEQKVAQTQDTMGTCSSEPGMQLQLQQALEQISHVSTALCDIQRYYQESKGAVEQSGVISELQNLKEQLEISERERKTLETQLSEAHRHATQLQEEVKQLQEIPNQEHKTVELMGEKSLLPPPPPPPPPPPSTPAVNLQDFLRSRRQTCINPADQTKPAPLLDMKAKAVDEMMERIKKGISLRPIQKIQDDDSSWKDQRSENRKSAVMELKVILGNMKHQSHRRVPSRRGIGRNVGESELLLVLQRRRKVMGDNQDSLSSTQTQDPQPGERCGPAAADGPWAAESSSAPVLRRLKQNREKRDSRIRASALVVSPEDSHVIPNI
ncbi:shootin-1 isoform X2 [Cololabis saira]|uniref:shootin-1 isoform X2 n=1 Tax=Cololabis saira TaxID=129043 RepID=UPI002AD4193F|nr:shootin-1 isoform X2 [Cololabis saira]